MNEITMKTLTVLIAIGMIIGLSVIAYNAVKEFKCEKQGGVYVTGLLKNNCLIFN